MNPPTPTLSASIIYRAALQAGIEDDTPAMNEAILSGLKRERQYAVDQAKSILKDIASAPPAPRRPSIQVSAPVSREAPMPSGKHRAETTMTLTPEEVDIAHRSFVDRPDIPRMTNAEKEWTFLQNKLRHQQMLCDGSYSGQKGALLD